MSRVRVIETMPTYCLIPGCDDVRKKQKQHPMSYHRFPKDRELCQQWLRAISHPRYDENTHPDSLKHQRVCSQHFTADDYERNLMAELMDKDKARRARTILKDRAVPSLFPQKTPGGGYTHPDPPGVSGASTADQPLQGQDIRTPSTPKVCLGL